MKPPVAVVASGLVTKLMARGGFASWPLVVGPPPSPRGPARARRPLQRGLDGGRRRGRARERDSCDEARRTHRVSRAPAAPSLGAGRSIERPPAFVVNYPDASPRYGAPNGHDPLRA